MSYFHFALGHLHDSECLQVLVHGTIFDLSVHTDESLAASKTTNPVFADLSPEKAKSYTHFVEIPDEHFDSNAPKWVKVVRPKQAGSHLNEVVLMSHIIPPVILRNFYRSDMWKQRLSRQHGRHAPQGMKANQPAINSHTNGRLYWLGIETQATDEEKAIDKMVAAQYLVDTQTTAAGLIAHHPDLATVQPVTAAYIRDAHILPDPKVNPDQYNAMQVLNDAMTNTPSWSPVIDCKDKNGNPITADYDLGEFKQGQKLQTFDITGNVLSASAVPIVGAKRTSSDDLQLQNQLWSPAPGTSVLKKSNTKNTALNVERLVEDTEFKWTVPYQTYTSGIKLDKDSLKIDPKNNFSIDAYNVYSRTFYVAFELFDDQGHSLGPRQSIDGLSAVDTIMGIPIPVFPTTERFNIGTASAIKIYFGSLGVSNWDKVSWDDLNVSDRGALLTGAWQYGIPIIFMIAGKIITSTQTFNKIVNDKELRLAAVAVLSFLVAGGVATKAALTNWKETMLQFGNVVISFVVKKGMEKLGEWLLEQVGEGELSNAFGPVGWLFKLAAVALDFELIAITTGEVLSSDSLVTAEIKRAIDVSLTLHPDPRHGEAGHPETAVWSSVAAYYVATLQVQGGTNFELKGTMPATTSGTPIPLLFENVPAGGNFRIFIGLYSANGWLASSWQNNWTPAVPNQGTTLNLGDKSVTENLVPLGIDTQYVYKEKIQYANSDFSWVANGEPPSTNLTSLNCAATGGLCELTAITVNNSAFQVGYIWRAANQHLHPDSPDAPISDQQLYGLQNLSVLADPGSRLISSTIGLTQKPGIAYAPSLNTDNTIDQNNFILDPRNGSLNLRQVVLDGESDFGLGKPNLLSWGSFPLDNLDSMAIHPNNAVLACSFSKHKLMILNLPAAPSPDGQAPEALLVSGEGVREGLMKGPKALAVAPDGRILILESLNNRVQAFDILGNAVPSFTPYPWVYTVNTADVAPMLDAGQVPLQFTDGLIVAGQNFIAPLTNASYIAELDSGKFQPNSKDPLLAALALLNINPSYDPDALNDPSVSSQIEVVQPGSSWIITDPRKLAWQILYQDGLLNVYQRPLSVSIKVQQPGERWLLSDNLLGLAWLLTVSSGNPKLVEVFDCLTYFPLQAGPNGADLNYLDMAVEAQGYLYILSYTNDGGSASDYLLDVYNPDGTFLFRSPDSAITTQPQNIVAGRLTVDIWRDLYALTYETLKGANGGLQPGLAHWTPTPPLFSFPLSEQPNFNSQNISAIKADFADHHISLSNQAFIEVINPDGFWDVKDGVTIYHVYRSGDALQVYSIPA
ncbi:hypothetical protein [Methylocucumis oryzae]|uniref:NHL repeat containing protein n=1 Tax=Methylocucumis oryzae TaxID=1632867 RepID=A0A0F3IIJ1_9GAMM|nr:hypothetical protein [Methylocucumis oryzae]KJV06546.1 hypothetical protein VZ94_10430 [Methylocucumis oryzae]